MKRLSSAITAKLVKHHFHRSGESSLKVRSPIDHYSFVWVAVMSRSASGNILAAIRKMSCRRCMQFSPALHHRRQCPVSTHIKCIISFGKLASLLYRLSCQSSIESILSQEYLKLFGEEEKCKDNERVMKRRKYETDIAKNCYWDISRKKYTFLPCAGGAVVGYNILVKIKQFCCRWTRIIVRQ